MSAIGVVAARRRHRALAFCDCYEMRGIPANAAAEWPSLALAASWLHGKKTGTDGYMDSKLKRIYYQFNSTKLLWLLEEEVGFEPTVPYGTPDFESGTFGHSATLPHN